MDIWAFQPYTLVGPPVWRRVLAPLAVNSLTTIYKSFHFYCTNHFSLLLFFNLILEYLLVATNCIWNYLKRDSKYSNVKIWDSRIWLIFHCVFYVTNAVFWKDQNSQKNNINICIEHWIMWSACSRALLIHNLLFDCCKLSLKWFLYPPTHPPIQDYTFSKTKSQFWSFFSEL